jgi:ComEC/Rec2-related protein
MAPTVDSPLPTNTATLTSEPEAISLHSSETQQAPIPTHKSAPKKLLAQYEAFLIPALILFLIGNALAFALPSLAFARLEIGVPLCLAFVGIVVYAIGQTGQGWAIKLNLWLIALLAGSLHFQYRQFTPSAQDISRLAPLERAEVMGTLLSQTGPHRGVLEVATLNGQKTSGRIQVSWPAEERGEAVASGTRLLISGSLALPYETQIPGAFNQADYLRNQHITAILKKPLRVIAFETRNEPRFVLQRLTDHFKDKIAQAFAQQLPSPQAEILGGLVLGDKAIPVDKAVKQAFIQTGLVHLLAASGMNVGIIAGAVLWLMTLLKVPYRVRIGVAMGAVAFYSLLTGLPPSIQRASAMLEIALALKLLNRELSPVFLLCVASTLLVGLNPDCIGSIGFQFSVLTTFGLLSMVPPLQEAIGYYITRWLAGIILVPLIAQLWVWPLSVAYFNQFPLHTVPLNIAALAMVTPLTVLGFTAGVLNLIWPMPGGLLSGVALPFLNGLLTLAQWGQAQSWAQWTLASPAPWQIFGLYSILFGLSWLIHQAPQWPKRFKALAVLLPLCVLLTSTWAESQQLNQQTRLALLPLSYRTEAVLVQPAHSHAHVLLAPETLGYFEARALSDYFRHHQITRLDALILLPQANSGPSGSNSWKTALKQTRIDRLITANSRELPPQITARQHYHFPRRGGVLQVKQWQLQGALNQSGQQLHMLENQRCLLAIQSELTSKNPIACGLQLISQRSGTRLIGPVPLQPERFYQLAHEGNTLKIY